MPHAALCKPHTRTHLKTHTLCVITTEEQTIRKQYFIRIIFGDMIFSWAMEPENDRECFVFADFPSV